MQFPEYEKWLTERVADTVLEQGCIQMGPFATPTVMPNKPPWQMEWTVFFRDGLFFRVKEDWFRRGLNLAGVYKIAGEMPGKFLRQNGLRGGSVYDLTHDRGVAIKAEQGEQALLEGISAGQAA